MKVKRFCKSVLNVDLMLQNNYSEGLLRIHKRTIHNIKETIYNITFGFKSDTKHHAYLLVKMGENIDKFICEKCDLKTQSKGTITIHKSELQ